MRLQFSVKVLMTDLEALLVPEELAKTRTEYEKIQVFLLDQVCKIFIYSSLNRTVKYFWFSKGIICSRYCRRVGQKSQFAV